MDILKAERIIGRKAIMSIIEPIYDIHTWQGVLYFVKKNNLPMRRTPAGRPYFLKDELINYEVKFQKIAISK
jgi:hypothetical protein